MTACILYVPSIPPVCRMHPNKTATCCGLHATRCADEGLRSLTLDWQAARQQRAQRGHRTPGIGTRP